MRKRKGMIGVSMLNLLVAFALCGCSSHAGSSQSKSQSESSPSTKNNGSTGSHKTKSTSNNNSNDKHSQSKGDTSKSNSNSHSTSSTKTNPASSQTNQQLADARANAVIQATLKVESRKPDTTVDYQSKTMTQSGKKVGFSIIPDENHQKDFKQGLISEIMDKTHNVTLYAYKFENNQLSLIDTGTSKVVYTVPFKNSSK